MSYSAQVTRGFLKRIFQAQLVFITLIAIFYSFTADIHAGIAAIFGGVIALVNTLLLRWNFERAEHFAGNDAGQNMKLLYRTAAQRLFSTIGLFVIALGVLKLQPLPLLVGFIAGVTALLVARYGFKK
ncbi:MAG: ATP synthase subunit I [Gammaproteobacteria bacterium]|nr:ATP synthase subunit I [Gammaproteobacteria bacterium]